MVQANTKMGQAKLKNGTQIQKWDTNIKMAQYKNGPIQKWCKRSFYQGPGVKFPFSWEKITLPP